LRIGGTSFVQESVSKQLEPKFKILAGMILVIFLLLIVRLWVLQIMEGATIMVKSRANQTRVIRINAPRGYFYDRNGEILVSTRISRNVSVVPEDVKDKPQVIALLAKILKMPVSEIEAKLQPDSKSNRSPYQYVTIKKDIDPATAIKILEAQMDLPGVEVDEVPVRYYKYGEYASHLFGYIREINDKELEAMKADGYKLGDLIGKSGLERTYEQYLRGTDGGKVFEVDIHGRRKAKLETKEPEPGNNLHLTIDHKVQQAAEKALEEHLIYLQKNTKYKNAKAGVAIALDPRNGDILAMVSKPGFDPNLFVGPISKEVANNLYNNKLTPLLNRAIGGEYAPGSTFKPVTVLAALNEQKVTAQDQFYCNGYDPVWKHRFKCWTATGGQAPHGRQTVIDGLKNSCNIVMAELSRRIGVDALAEYTRYVGFGKPTGIELYPGEKKGFVADRQWKEKNTRDKKWFPLETLHFGIGQGYLTVTPIQLAQFYAALANNGVVYKPRVVTKITDASGKTVKSFPPQKVRELNIPAEDLAIVKKGLEEVISGGTAAAYFRGFPLDKYPVAGKTGTAQRYGYDNGGVFASFAPADKPEIVVVVFVEQGGSGSAGAAPIARKIFEAYFGIGDENPKEGKKPETTEATANRQAWSAAGHGSSTAPVAPVQQASAGQPVSPSNLPATPGVTSEDTKNR